MNPALFFIYSSIATGTVILMTILVKYLQEKALQKQQVKDKILSDLAILTGTWVVSSASLVLTREVVGPFDNVTLVATLFVLLQYLYNVMLSCIVSLQV